MKKIFVTALLLSFTAPATGGQVSTKNVWTETYAVSSATPRLVVKNIWGSVRVRPGISGEITLTIDEHRSAPDQERLLRSQDTLKLNLIDSGDGLSVIVGDRNNRWHNEDPCPGCRADYQFDIAVPPDTYVDVETVMDGAIDVSGVNGTVSAGNVNGPIRVHDLYECDKVSSVNGAVDMQFDNAPQRTCNIETINGDVTLQIPDGAGLDVSLDLFNGRVASEFEVDTFVLPARVEHSQRGDQHRYRVHQPAGIRVAGGGPVFSISSMNGDIRIEKNQ